MTTWELRESGVPGEDWEPHSLSPFLSWPGHLFQLVVPESHPLMISQLSSKETGFLSSVSHY